MNEKKERNKIIVEDYKNGDSTVLIGKKFNISPSTVWRILKRYDVEIRPNTLNSRRYSLNESFFEKIDTEEKAYWLGFMYADGYITTKLNNYSQHFGISLAKKDYDHLEKFKKSLNSTYPIKEYISTGYSNTEYCRLLMSSQKTVDNLIRLGVVEQKTNVLTFPTEEQVPKHLLHHFIRGYFDGDGCITSYLCGGYIRYKTSFIGCESILDGINEAINEKYKVKIPRYFKRKTYQTVYSLEYASNKRSIMLYEYMYKDATIFLERKRNKFLKLVELNGNIEC